MLERIGNFFTWIFSAISNFSDWLDTFSLRRLDDDDNGLPPSMLKRVLRWPLWAITVLFVTIAKIIRFPFQVVGSIARAGSSEWALCLPALLIAGLAAFAMVRVHLFGGDIINRYRRAALAAINTQDWELAKTYLGRIVNSSGDINDVDRLRWAAALEQTGSPSEAGKVMDALAPEDRPGSALGHRAKALTLARQAGRKKQSDTLERLHWHLKNAGEPEGWQLNQAWSVYYFNLGEKAKGIEFLKAAAQFKPEYWLTVAEFYKRNGNAADERLALEEAAAKFERKATNDPSDVRSRVIWAKALVQMKQINRAEEVLLQGFKLKDEPFIRRELADFYLMRHDRAAIDDPDNFQLQFEFLKRAIDLDVNNGKTYERLIYQFVSRPKGEDSQRVRELVESMIAEGKNAALAHFALANILWMSGDKTEAQWHMEQAYKSDNRLVMVANNLAWFLANSESPDLDRALKLAKDAVARNPDPRFRDTLGTVLMKQEKYEEALTEFEEVLKAQGNKKAVHEKLAFIYDKLGKPRMADLHRQNMKN